MLKSKQPFYTHVKKGKKKKKEWKGRGNEKEGEGERKREVERMDWRRGRKGGRRRGRKE